MAIKAIDVVFPPYLRAMYFQIPGWPRAYDEHGKLIRWAPLRFPKPKVVWRRELGG